MSTTCASCDEAITDGVKCPKCKGLFHFGCAGVREGVHRKWDAEKKKAWRCSNCTCASSPLPQVNQEVSLNTILQELRETRSDLKSEISEVKSDVRDVHDKLATFDERLQNLESLKTEHEGLSKQVQEMMSTISELRCQISQKDQQDRINNIEISGIPFKKNENLNNLLHTICTKVGFTLTSGDIDTIHRVRRFKDNNPGPSVLSRNDDGADTSQHVPHTNIPNIIVRFTQRRRKNELMSAVRARRGLTTAELDFDGPARTVYISEHLSPGNKLLLRKVRAISKEHGYKHVFVRECKILVIKKDDQRPVLISKESDLSKLSR
ncbi:uncharacterized protein LOC125240150 [Leguminivora glycinivorella]|uniref:uncharacterized protein LOC125226884 n=1 Tax=Leguminivora glycinivorella TaxID=1035111 RepID=UPI00200BD711|nr:uncharacterized protein LOC125226884 [Leguminivora glycinivorella]XP_048003954.1 uncharacterized protein LOC125240150 [Leguminivora glycinivorella]